MSGTVLRFVDIAGTKGKVVYLTVNCDPVDVVADTLDCIPKTQDDSQEGAYLADVRTFDDTDSLNYYITDTVLCDEVCPADVTCLHGILYSGEEFPVEDCGIDAPDVVMLLATDVLQGDEDITLVNELTVYDGKNIAEQIEQYLQNMYYLQHMHEDSFMYPKKHDDFFIFVGDIKHVSCVVEE